MSFAQLGLADELVRALTACGYTSPTPIQSEAIPAILTGRDLLAAAQTGTGKTAGFMLPLLQRLSQHDVAFSQHKSKIRALILTPTRELAAQVEEAAKEYGQFLDVRSMVMFGGVNIKPQIQRLYKRVDILVATPGRLLDHVSQRTVDLSGVETLILDEADRMLDMGFIHDVKKLLLLLPKKRQSLFFSATMPPEIVKLANSILTEPQKVEVTPVSSTADTIKQAIFFVDKGNKNALLLDVLENKDIKTETR